MDLVGDQVGGIGHEDADGDLDGAVVDAAFEQVNDPAYEQSDADAGDDQPEQGQHPLQRTGYSAADDDGDGELQGEEASGVVDQALAFEHVNDAAGKPDALGDGGCGNGVGRRDDCSQDEAEPPVKAEKDPGSDQSYSKDSEDDQTEGEEENADDVEAEVAPGGGPRGGVKQRWQNYEEDEIRFERDVRNGWDEAQDEPADDHDDRVGSADLACELTEGDDEEQQKKEDQLDRSNIGHGARSGSTLSKFYRRSEGSASRFAPRDDLA